MTKKDSKQIIAMLKALQYLQSTFSDYQIKWEVNELAPEEITIHIDCEFQDHASILYLLLDHFSVLHVRIDGEELIIN